MKTRYILPVLFVLAGATTASSEPAAAVPMPAAPAKVSAPATAEASAPAAVKNNKDTLSVDFPDEDVRTILRNVADLFDLNVVIPDTLTGKTSVKLRDVTWRQIFQVVLTPIGYTYIEDTNIIKIVSQESLQQEPTTTEVFILNYARAADIKPTIEPLVSSKAGGKVQVDTRSNALVVTERPSQLNFIRPIITQLDKATDQVMIESKFVEVHNVYDKNIGVNWSSLKGLTLGASNLKQTYSRDHGQNGSDGVNGNSGLTGETSSSTSMSSALTNNPTNVSSVTSTNGTITNTSTTGTNNGISTNNSIASSTASGTTIAQNVLNTLTNTAVTDRLATAVFSASDFNVILSALISQNDTKLVSNPTVVTLNNTEATINIGTDYPLPRFTYNAEHGNFEVSGFDYKSIGINLKVTPQVNAQGFIKLIIAPEVSSFAGSVPFGGSAATTIPIISTRKTTTQVTLKDGFTMGIGGLISTNTTNGQTKIPIMGDIPLLGRLFRSDSKNIDSTNLLVFITARTVNPEGASADEVFDPRAIKAMGMRRDELPGYREKGQDPFASETPLATAKKH